MKNMADETAKLVSTYIPDQADFFAPPDELRGVGGLEADFAAATVFLGDAAAAAAGPSVKVISDMLGDTKRRICPGNMSLPLAVIPLSCLRSAVLSTVRGLFLIVLPRGSSALALVCAADG